MYRVKAVSPTGVSQWSSYVRADTPPDPADLAPSGLSAKAVSGDDGVIEGVELAWNAPAEDAASVTGYEILRAVGDGDLATLVADTGSADTSYTDDTATEAGESYAYRVKALRGEEASQPSNRAEAIIPKVTAVEPEPPIAERQSGDARVPADWSLIPSGLGEGDRFRLIFLSSIIRTATATDIADYNTWIQNLAANGHADIQQYSSTFRVVGSTAVVDARDNTNTTYTNNDKGVAIYWLGGNKVADDYEGFYDGEWDDEANVKDQSGNNRSTSGSSNRPFTGSDHDGTESLSGSVSRALGATQVLLGRLNDASGGPLSSASATANFNFRPFYGLSEVFLIVSADAEVTLSALSLSDSMLSPSFAVDTLTYTGSVRNVVSMTTVTATPHDDGATVAIVPADADDVTDGHQVALPVGDTAISVTVTAENGTTMQTYTVTVTRAEAQEEAVTTVPADWGLTPSGLGAGARFRLLFLSSGTRDAIPIAIADYDTWIQNLAANGHADIQQYSSTFRVVGSTAVVDARDNTNTTYTNNDKGVAIYWLSGNKVADDYEGFYDGEWDDEANVKDQSGNNRSTSGSSNRPFTGSGHDGTESFNFSNASRALGASSVRLGRPNDVSGGPLSSGNTTSNFTVHPLYGLSGVFRVEGQTTTNAAPVFAADTDLRTVPENSPTGTSVGDPVTAMDDDSDTLAYTLEGTDAASFEIDASTGQIQTISGVTYDHEAKPSYSVTVKADDSNGGTDTIAVTINVADVDEPPSAPGAPTVTPVLGSSDSLSVTWTAPDNTGKPDIESYDLRFRKGTSGSWTVVSVDGTGTILTGLDAASEYQVQMRATNNEGDGDWSASGSGTTNAASTLAGTEVPANWSLIPSGLDAGDRFRLIFISSTTRDGSSTDIADYNTFVQNATAAGHPDIQGHSPTFRVVGSTTDVNARDNTSTTHTADDKGVPIYWLGGNKVADQYQDFYDGGWDDEANAKDEFGNDRSTAGESNYPITGSAYDGTADAGFFSPTVLGTTFFVMTGRLDHSGAPLQSDLPVAPTASRPMYGLSGVFVVSSQGKTGEAPAFALNADTRGVEENSDGGVNVGDPVTATDGDGDILTYRLEGPDAASFAIDSASGQIQTKPGVVYDFEGTPSYAVTVRADDGNGGRVTIAVAINLIDVDEPPTAPGAPTAFLLSGATDSLSVSWTPPDNTGKPDIESYDLRYRKGSSGDWTDGPQNVTLTSATITGLDADSSYQVQVQATSDEGESPWSDSGYGSTSAQFDVLVSNAGAGVLETIRMDLNGWAQSFDTGPNTEGYDFKSILLWISSLGSPGTTTASLREDDGGSPSDTALYPLTVPATLVDDTLNAYTAPDGASLDANTTYWFVIKYVNAQDQNAIFGGPHFHKVNLMVGLDPGAAPGWNIDAPAQRGGLSLSGTEWAAPKENGAMKIQVLGRPRGEADANNSPAFPAETATRELPENSAASENVGAAVTATDADTGATLTYNLEGNHGASFYIDAASGQIKTKAGVTYDYEARPSYLVTVKVRDGNEGADTIAVTINLTDVDEPPAAPDAPTVMGVDGSGGSLSVSWVEPDTTGIPSDLTYDLQYRKTGITDWTDGPQDETGTSATITGLDAVSEYQVQVRATNHEGDSLWSASGTGSTQAEPVPANWGLIPSELGVGDRFRLIFITSGTRDGSSTDIADYNTFVQTAAAAGHADIQDYSSTFRVVGSTAGVDARDNTYTADDTGVAIYWLGGAKVADDYADFYDGEWDDEANAKDESGNVRITSGSADWPFTGSTHDGIESFNFANHSKALGANLVRVGQPNDASGGPLSSDETPGKANTRPFYGLSAVFVVQPNVAPAFTSDATFSVEENQTAAGTVAATDADAGDAVTYAVTGGADLARFQIVAATGALTFASAPDHESPTDADTNSVYLVTVTATGGTGNRALTATQDITVTVTDVDETPEVDSVVVTSTPTAAQTYGAGETIEVTVTFDQAVTVTGTPRIKLRVGGGSPQQQKWADYAGGTGSEELVFAYTVQAGDRDTNGIYIQGNELQLNGGTIQGMDDDVAADLDYATIGTQSGHEVDGSLSTTNTAPEFEGFSGSSEVPENSPPGTAVLISHLATDGDGDTLTYTLEGTDAASFDIDASTGQITTKSGVTYDHEAKSSYSVTVKADDGNGGTDTIAVTINITDVDEPPAAPAAPTVSPVADSTTSLSVTWTPDNTGKPDIQSYDLQYRKGTTGDWTDGPQDETGLSATLTGLDAGTEYQVRVRATNNEGDSDWSSAGSGTTGAIPTLAITLSLDVDSNVTVDSSGRLRVSEDYGDLRVGLRTEANVQPTEDFEVTLNIVDKGTVAGSDYRWPSSTYAFSAAGFMLDGGRYVLTVSNDLEVIDDEIVEMDQAVGLEIDDTALPSYVTAGGAFAAEGGYSLVILNDDEATVSMVDIVMNEGEQAEARLLMSHQVEFAFGVTLVILDNQSHQSLDEFEDIVFTATFESLAREATFTVESKDNSRFEPDQTFEVNLVQDASDSIILDEDPRPTITVIDDDNAPTFSADTDLRTVPENSPTGTSVGDPVTATDDDGDALTYTLEGTDAASFDIDASTGQIRTKSGVTYDHEAKSSYSVTVKADDGNGGTDTIAVTINVADVDEPPSAPGAPTVTPVLGSSDSLSVTWTAPDNTGKPDIESYDLQYRIGTSAWTDGPQDETGLSATISGLDAGSEYQVQVRATNDEGDSDWSSAGTGTTNAQAEAPSVLAINASDGTYAIDQMLSVTVVFSAAVTVSGTPQLALDIGGETRHADYESGTGTQSLPFSYTVAEGDEDTDGVRVPPDSLALNGGAITAGGLAATLIFGGPNFPRVLVDGVRPTLVSAETSVDGNTVSVTFSESLLSADANRFQVSHGDPSVSSATIDPNDDRVVTLTLSRAVSHDDTLALEIAPNAVQDAAGNYNDRLSDSITNNVPPPANAAPVFTSAATFIADENQTAVGTVMATDADAGDTVTYAITGGDDQTHFQIVAASGVLTFATAPDHENPADAGTNNDYQVTVTATGGTGARALTTEQDITVTVNDVDETPAITSVSVVSNPGADNTYGLGDTIEVQVVFDQAVIVTGTPRIEFEVGGNQPEHLKLATYADGSGTTTLRFDYVVEAADMDDNGIWLKGDKLELNGGTILGVDDDVAANLDYSSLGRQDDHKVDGSLTTTNTAPIFFLESITREVDENSPAGTDVGDPVTATDADNDTLTYTLEGTDAASFQIDSTSGQIRTKSGVTYDYETKSSYSVMVKADDGNGGSDTIPVAIDLRDVDETAPGDFVSVCDRSPAMKFSLVYEVSGITPTTDLDGACKRVTPEHLANIYSLTVWGPSSLSARDLDGLTGLRLLSLSRGSLDRLPKGIFGGLGKLEKLNILYTDLDRLDPGIFGDRADDLKSLALWGNDITSLPDGVFDGLTALEELSIIEVGIQALPADLLDNNTKLKKLTMRIGSGWTQMESGFLSDLGQLRELHLGGNGLTSLPDGVFDNNRKLKKVYLYNNALASLPDGVFSNNTALEKVYLADNELTSLPDGIFDTTAKLKTVDLRNNNLETLPGDLFPHGEPDKLYLSGNPGHPFTFD